VKKKPFSVEQIGHCPKVSTGPKIDQQVSWLWSVQIPAKSPNPYLKALAVHSAANCIDCRHGTSLTYSKSLAYPCAAWVFIETDNFNKAITALMPDEADAKLQQALVDDPELGELIQGTGGLRKVRWALSGKGKRGGARVIYFWRDRAAQIIFLMIYGKGVRTDLSAGEKRQLRQAAEALK
jgi:hypothetical protein